MQIVSLLLILFLFLTRYLYKTEKREFLVSFILFISLIFIGLFIFSILYLMTSLFERTNDYLDIHSLFFSLFLVIILTGILLYFVLKRIVQYWKITMTVLTIIEYYIQWSLIYVTVYQVLFDNIQKTAEKLQITFTETALDPQLIILFILPTFISIWISVILLKVDNNIL
ncbi:hypothetical protein D929_01897 [Enterococcus faecalis 02-MB-P-10]|nr:hypothetical protein D929_01897 [Enterococcus faecalis 02-MB-P-10]